MWPALQKWLVLQKWHLLKIWPVLWKVNCTTKIGMCYKIELCSKMWLGPSNVPWVIKNGLCWKIWPATEPSLCHQNGLCFIIWPILLKFHVLKNDLHYKNDVCEKLPMLWKVACALLLRGWIRLFWVFCRLSDMLKNGQNS